MNIIVDTREQQPFSFAGYPEIKIINKKLDIGDYSIEGFEDIITIDRKKNLSEIVKNLKEKRFLKELEKMSTYDEAYMLCSFPFINYSKFPEDSGIPKRNWSQLRQGGMAILNKVKKLECDYCIPFLYCNDRLAAERRVVEIFRNFLGKINGE